MSADAFRYRKKFVYVVEENYEGQLDFWKSTNNLWVNKVYKRNVDIDGELVKAFTQSSVQLVCRSAEILQNYILAQQLSYGRWVNSRKRLKCNREFRIKN